MKDLGNMRNEVRTEHLESGTPSSGNWRTRIEKEVRGHLSRDKENDVKKYQSGGPIKKAAGGKLTGKTMYEKDEVGERSTTKAPHINYTAQMKGEHPTSYKKGGHKMKMGGEMEGMSEGGERKMALGGAGKIRKKMSTMKGKMCK